MSTPASRYRRLTAGGGFILFILALALFRASGNPIAWLQLETATPVPVLAKMPQTGVVATTHLPTATVRMTAVPLVASAAGEIATVLPPTRSPLPTMVSSPTPSRTPFSSLTPIVSPSPAPSIAHSPTSPAAPTVLVARVVPANELPPPHLILERPFTADFRQLSEATYPYGSKGDGRLVLHTGIDIGNPDHTPVLAVADAVVVYSGRDDARLLGPKPLFYGDVILMRLLQPVTAQPLHVLYGHLSERYVKSGEAVLAGQVIGAVGMTGIAMGPHLHVEVRAGDESLTSTRNPALWLRPLPDRGILAGRIGDGTGRALPGQTVWIYRAKQRDRIWSLAQSYPAEPTINGDDLWQENFVAGDLPVGDYVLQAGRPGLLAEVPFTINDGAITFVEVGMAE